MQSTWSADSNTWSSTPYTWSNSSYPVTAVMPQTILSKTIDEDTLFPRSLSLGGSYGMSGTSAVLMSSTASLTNSSSLTTSNTGMFPVSTTLGGTTDIITNVNYPESITMDTTGSASTASGFLWDDIPEDTSSSWVASTDASETWTDITEDSGTVWTPED